MVLATIIRLELAYPGVGIFAGDSLQYLSMVTAHGVIMVFFMIMPLLFGAFGNFLLPTQLGVHDVAFPRLNSAAFWFLPAGLIMLGQLVCIDRRYQRMNCFNIREVQSLLKRKFFVDLINTHDYKILLDSSMINLKYKTNDLTFNNLNSQIFYNFGISFDLKNRNIDFFNLTKNDAISNNLNIVNALTDDEELTFTQSVFGNEKVYWFFEKLPQFAYWINQKITVSIVYIIKNCLFFLQNWSFYDFLDFLASRWIDATIAYIINTARACFDFICFIATSTEVFIKNAYDYWDDLFNDLVFFTYAIFYSPKLAMIIFTQNLKKIMPYEEDLALLLDFKEWLSLFNKHNFWCTIKNIKNYFYLYQSYVYQSNAYKFYITLEDRYVTLQFFIIENLESYYIEMTKQLKISNRGVFFFRLWLFFW